jgi:hypothetical protein
LGIELRRSMAVVAALLTLAFLTTLPTSAEGMSRVLREQREVLWTVAPLALGLGALQSLRDRRSRMGELLGTTARPGWQRRLHTAAALGGGVVAGYLIGFLGLSVYAAVVGAYYPFGVVSSALVAPLALAAALWLGMAAGRLVPWVLAPVLIAVAGFVLVGVLFVVGDTEGYAPPPAKLLLTVNMIGLHGFEALTASARLAQALWVVGIAGACLLLCVASRYALLLAVVPAALGLFVAQALLPDSLWDAITIDEGAAALVCTPDEPRVCARRVESGVLDYLLEPGRRALLVMQERLPQSPAMLVTELHGHDLFVERQRDAEILYADVPSDGSGGTDLSEDDIVWTLLLGAGTPACWDTLGAIDDVARYDAARIVTAAWLLETRPRPPSDLDGYWGWVPPTTVTGPIYEALRDMPEEEQQARVAAYREAELACTAGDRVEMLIGP